MSPMSASPPPWPRCRRCRWAEARLDERPPLPRGVGGRSCVAAEGESFGRSTLWQSEVAPIASEGHQPLSRCCCQQGSTTVHWLQCRVVAGSTGQRPHTRRPRSRSCCQQGSNYGALARVSRCCWVYRSTSSHSPATVTQLLCLQPRHTLHPSGGGHGLCHMRTDALVEGRRHDVLTGDVVTHEFGQRISGSHLHPRRDP